MTVGTTVRHHGDLDGEPADVVVRDQSLDRDIHGARGRYRSSANPVATPQSREYDEVRPGPG